MGAKSFFVPCEFFGKKIVKNNIFYFAKMEKKTSQLATVYSPGRYAGNHFFFKGGLSVKF